MQTENFRPIQWRENKESADVYNLFTDEKIYPNQTEIIDLIMSDQEDKYNIVYDKLPNSWTPFEKSFSNKLEKIMEYFTSEANMEMIQYMIDTEPYFTDTVVDLDWRLFEIIVKNDLIDIFKLLLDSGHYQIDNFRCDEGNAIFRYDNAKFIQYFEVTTKIIELIVDKNKINCLQYCIDAGYLEQIKLALLVYKPLGIKIETMKLLSNYIDLSSCIDRLLVSSTINMDLDCVKFCLEYGAYAGSFALELSGDPAITMILLENGADVSLVDVKTENAIMLTSKRHCYQSKWKLSFESLKLKIGAGLIVSTELMTDIFCHICVQRFKNFLTVELFNWFMDYGLDRKILFSSHAVHWMITNQCLDLCMYIIDNYLSEIDSHLDSFLLCATANGHLDLIQNLVEYGANPLGSKPLLTAIAFGHYDLVQYYLGFGIDLNLLELDLVAAIIGGCRKQPTVVNIFSKLRENSKSFYLNEYTFGNDYDKIFDLLIEHGLILSDPTIFELLYDGYDFNYANTNNALFDRILLCSANQINVNDSRNKKFLPLVLAIESKNYDLIQALLDLGADVAAGNFYPIYQAIRTKEFKALQICFQNAKYIDSSAINEFLKDRDVIDAYYRPTMSNCMITTNDSIHVKDIDHVSDQPNKSDPAIEFYEQRKQLVEILIAYNCYF